ncbi:MULTISPECIES: HD-GYP domain-containing protein [Psychrilyobacter]|uniref:HD domain-containing protein n=2 Tax=Fusobacteriaceae TaxID=203492 RepID=A0ABX9KK14_9FUSO|nr:MULTISPECIES: HD-GYP domain-containing protein [Psychrilyobacter]MCS5423154.1 HD-GYP domain-containing protein [Psychrilyobacter sp. S5]NDI76919.1 HD-GYP domain-containing protein [Psychrilyobacter piezotolerans]RDE65196.1 HD-GYP domain-containing protein [Psychrilyobacter sp. S5]REI42766.1 HD domain-containing protein [Psychrilyobacter piezotolerans]
MNNLFGLSMKMLSSIEYNDKYFIKKIFRIASPISNKNDLGRAYTINNGKAEYIDSIGFDLKELNKNIDFYKTSPKKTIINRKYKKEVEQKLKNKEPIDGFSLDINKGSSKSYFDKTILQNNIVQSFIRTLEVYDDYTKGHSELVAIYSVRIGESLGLDKKQLENLYWAAVMHDIGKIMIPVDILNKTEKLTDSEFDLIKKHPQIGYEIISKNKTLKDISKYILSHHERWDGKGYPNGLTGDEIPLLSQIICVADCWHAMTSKRSYKNKLSEEEAIEDLLKNRGTQFSPKIIDIFIEEKLYSIDKYFKGNKIVSRYA